MDLLITTITLLLIGGAVLTVIGLVAFSVISFKAYKTYKEANIQHDQFDEAMDEKRKQFEEERKRIEERMNRTNKWL